MSFSVLGEFVICCISSMDYPIPCHGIVVMGDYGLLSILMPWVTGDGISLGYV